MTIFADQLFTNAPKQSSALEKLSPAAAKINTLAGTQESMLQQLRDPLTVFRIGLASRNCLNVLRVREQKLKLTFKNVPHRLPLDPCGLHGHVLNLKLA